MGVGNTFRLEVENFKYLQLSCYKIAILSTYFEYKIIPDTLLKWIHKHCNLKGDEQHYVMFAFLSFINGVNIMLNNVLIFCTCKPFPIFSKFKDSNALNLIPNRSKEAYAAHITGIFLTYSLVLVT